MSYDAVGIQFRKLKRVALCDLCYQLCAHMDMGCHAASSHNLEHCSLSPLFQWMLASKAGTVEREKWVFGMVMVEAGGSSDGLRLMMFDGKRNRSQV